MASQFSREKAPIALWSPWIATPLWWYASCLVSLFCVIHARWEADSVRIELITKSYDRARDRKLRSVSAISLTHRALWATYIGIFGAHTVHPLKPRRCRSMDNPMIW